MSIKVRQDSGWFTIASPVTIRLNKKMLRSSPKKKVNS